MNKKFLPALLIAALCTVVIYSCTKTSEKKYGTNYGEGYYPLQFGRYVVYDVDSFIWDDFQCVKTKHHYQLRYSIVDTFRDNQNRISYKMDVHIRKQDTLTWNMHRVIYVTPTTTHLEYVEENLRFIKLAYPVAEGATWKGNAMISPLDQDYQYFQDWDYTYSGFGKPFNNGFVNFDNTITVSEVDELLNDPESMPNNYAYKTFAKEVYGWDVGMVYREITRWVYDPTGSSKCRKGYSVIMRAVEHN